VAGELANFPLAVEFTVDRKYTFSNAVDDLGCLPEIAVDVKFPQFPTVTLTIYYEDDIYLASVMYGASYLWLSSYHKTAVEALREALVRLVTNMFEAAGV
jgi:hypothetical protein